MGFGGEGRLQRAEGAESAGRRVVGVDAVGVDAHIGNDIRPGGKDRRLAHDALRRKPIGAAVADHGHVQRANAAVARKPHAQLGARGMTLGGGDDQFLAGEHQPHRAPRLHRQERQHALVDHVFLAAEAAAHRAHDEAHFADRLGDDARQHVAVMGDVLVGRDDGDDIVVVEIGEPRLRLEIGVLDGLRRIILLDHQIGFGKAFLDVADADRDVFGDIVAAR